ncbi:Mg-chelatase subunit ChlD [Thioflavicoccus mobilis 8321]|uniref:Mg-chelatase subunit ChlD n=1 Tax=Thioflavicoccus mobilis 8321 TaxID=765912 RepID=L0GT22_9GAMM|nr:VWA domain-containing protein [Thioflavicoccus mobilis]AGA89918.1 Mg-chelatase subunit ChlD [Thioflavicoccus mobilis 8321]
MFEFQWPWAALLLPLPWLLRHLWPRLRPRAGEASDAPAAEQRITLRHPHIEALADAFQTRRPRRHLAGWVYEALLALLWAALVIALMRPQWLEPYTEISRPGYDLMITVDASRSMNALDFTVSGEPVTRMRVVKGVLDRFIAQREGDRVGLILFGTEAFLLAPLSLDRQAVGQLLDGVVPSEVAGPATALGDGIALGVRKLRERPAGSRVMVLIADGDNTTGHFTPGEATQFARLEGVRIYVIGVGSRQERIGIEVDDGSISYDEDFTMDEDALRRIAEVTGGAYFRATDTDALEAISTRIDALEKTRAEARTAYLPRPLFRWPLGVALAALLALGLFPEGRRRLILGPSRG